MSDLTNHLEGMADSLDESVDHEDVHRLLIEALNMSQQQDAKIADVRMLHHAESDTEDVLPQECAEGPCEHEDECPEVTITPCAECSRPGLYYVAWPCATLNRITEALK